MADVDETRNLTIGRQIELPSRRANKVEPNADIGVVIIGRNEGARLSTCLASLAPFGLPMTYVDSDSTDGSQVTARAAGADVIELDVAVPFTAARARHEGATALLSQHPNIRYIQFVDGDCSVDADWLSIAHAFLEGSSTYAVACGRRRERYPNQSLYNALADVEWATAVGEAIVCGGDALYRVSAYRKVGGFNPRLIAGEEPELCSRLRGDKWRIRRLDHEMTIHDAGMTRLSQWWQRAVRSGLGYAQAWQGTRNSSEPLYRREIVRAVGWTVGPVALAALGAVTLWPEFVLFAPSLYLIQIVRLAGRFGIGSVFSWQRACLLVLGKVAETMGVLRFIRRSLRGSLGGTIFYK